MVEAVSPLWRSSKFNCPAQGGSHPSGFPVSPRILYNLSEQHVGESITTQLEAFPFAKIEIPVFQICAHFL